jgi:hypothetical protein
VGSCAIPRPAPEYCTLQQVSVPLTFHHILFVAAFSTTAVCMKHISTGFVLHSGIELLMIANDLITRDRLDTIGLIECIDELWYTPDTPIACVFDFAHCPLLTIQTNIPLPKQLCQCYSEGGVVDPVPVLHRLQRWRLCFAARQALGRHTRPSHGQDHGDDTTPRIQHARGRWLPCDDGLVWGPHRQAGRRCAQGMHHISYSHASTVLISTMCGLFSCQIYVSD